ncbi:SpaA isopeptide-forming pilin-related protein [Dorea sp.]
MRKELQKKAENLKQISHKAGRWKKIVTVLACVVVFCTTYALILPAITLESGEKLICTEESVSGHVHNAECKDADGRIQCGYADYVIHTHDENCKDADGNLICGLDEIKEHTHTDECYEVNAEEVSETDGRAEEEKDEASETDGRTEEEKDKADDNNDETAEKKLICTEPEVIAHIHDENCKDAEGNLICGKIQILKHEHQKECIEKEADTEEKKEKSPIEEIKKDDQTSEEEQIEQGEKEDNTETESEELKRTEEAKETDKKTPEIKEPETEAPEKEAPVKNQDKQEKDEETTNNISEKNNDKEIKESGQESEQEKEVKKEDANLRKHRMTHEGKDYTVHVTFGEDAELPTDVKLEVEEIKQGSAEYKDYYKQAEEALPEEQGFMFCRFFDVSFISDGKKVEPKASVEVEISYKESVPQQKGVETNAIHFAEDGIEVLPAEVEQNADGEDTFSFTQDSFSVVGTAVSAINLSEGSYIFYRDGYALGVNKWGIIAMPVTVDENGYVSPKDSKVGIDYITWSYDSYGYLKNKKYEEYLTLEYDQSQRQGYVNTSTHGQRLQARIINNTIRIAYIDSSTYPTGERGYYLGFDDKKHTFTVGNTFASGDYLFGAKVANVDGSKIETGDLEVKDTIKEEGVLKPEFNGASKGEIITYTWYRSDNGSGNWTKVERKRVTGDSYNVAEDGSWLNVPLDGGADKYYKVEIATMGGAQLSPSVESKSYHVPYYDQVQNGDFEEPVIPYDDNTTYNEHYQPLLPNGTAGMVWKTTASDGEIEFVSVASDAFQEWSEKWHNCEKAANGKQYVELNATMPGALYQDVLTVPGSTMYWSLAHRGRGPSSMKIGDPQSKDTMYVVIMSAKDAEGIVTQEQVDRIINNPERYSAKVISITDDNKEWVYHTGEYEVPDGQYLTRYFFGAGETSFDRYGGEENVPAYTVGNHLDDIHFSTELAPPAKGKINLEIYKTIVGLDEQEAENLLKKLQFKINETRVSGADFKNFKQNEDGSYTASYQVQETIGSNVNEVTKYVSEDLSTADAEGYIRTSTTYAIGENGLKYNYDHTKNVEVTIADRGTGIISFVNTYAPETADISISKINDETTPQALSGAVFSLDVQNDTTWDTFNNTIEVNDNGIANINHLLYDKLYRLTETKAPDGYSKLTDHIYFKIQKENGKAKIIPYNENGTQLTKWPDQANVSSAEPLKLTVINNKKAMLPETGGSGTNRTYAVGIMMILTSGMIYGCREKTRWGRRRH